MAATKFAKGARRQVETCACAWIDLLGYGAMIAKAEFNPLKDEAQQALTRINSFQAIVAKHSSQLFSSFVMNDGAAIHRDLSPRSHTVTDDFLSRCWELYGAITEAEKASGFPGARMFLAAGLRSRPVGREAKATHRNSLLRRLEEGLITPQQAVSEAVAMPRNSDVVPELQGNFAFTRAYMADSQGSRVGLPGPAFYLDAALVNAPYPDWLSISKEVPWEWSGMKTTFLKIENLQPAKGGARSGARDAIQVAEELTGDAEVASQLSKLRLTSPRIAGTIK